MREAAFPPRLHVLLAREAKTGLVIRRGPSKRVCTIGWDRENDRFTIGQWLNGRIYERRCDLSPDGKHLIYFAMNGRWSGPVKGSWSAISKTPYLKALALFPKGDCWHGGGLFLSDRDYWLNDGYGHETRRDVSGLKRTQEYPWHEHYGGECLGVYYIRLQRDGWKLQEYIQKAEYENASIFDKRINNHWSLRKFAHATINSPPGRGCYYDEHALWNPKTETLIPFPDWEWADVDRNRIAWTVAGSLHVGKVGSKGLEDDRCLQDFSSLSFERLTAPY